MTAAAFRLVSTADGLGIAQVGSVCLVVWQSPVTQERFDRQRAALEAVAAQHVGPACLLCVIASGTPPPDSHLRRASIDMVTGLRDRLACIACVIEGSGFRAATTRSVLAGMSLLLARSKLQVHFAASVSSAATWVAGHCEGASAAPLIEAHACLVSELGSG